MALRLWSRLSLSAVVMVLLTAACLAADRSGNNDVSEVVFAADTNDTGLVCTEAVPENISITEPDQGSVEVTWDRPNVDGTFQYQVLYWQVTTTTYLCITNLTQTRTELSDLVGAVTYAVTVRMLCPDNLTYPGPGGNIERFTTPARAPSGFPEIVKVDTCYNNMCDLAIVTWNPLPLDLWNGLELFYEVYSADITPGLGQNGPTAQVYYPGTNITLSNLQEGHDYIVSVRAVSSGGLGPVDVPTVFTVDVPTSSVEPSPELLESWWVYLLIFSGAAVLLAAFLTLIIICIKKCVTKKGVVYARDISRNIQDGRIPMTSFGSLMRADQIRLSHRGRPLPAQPPHPLQHTPSTTSMNAHLLKEASSPQYPPMSAGMAFEIDQYPARKLPHPGGLPKLEADPSQFGHMNVQSPPYPQLYRPFSDLSSAASSVFTESNIPHDLDPRQVSSSGPSSAANPYEVPADSETGHHSVSGHPSSISPPAHMNTLPSPRRPQTATAMMASQPAFPPAPNHHPPPLTQSSLELFHTSHPAPPIPPHQINNSVGQLHSSSPMEEWKQDLAKLAAAVDPTDADYSEVPSDSPNHSVGPNHTHRSQSALQPHQAGGIPRMPSMERSSAHPSYGHENSLVGSNHYSSYSDVPHAVGKEDVPEIEPYQGPMLNNHQGQFSRSSSMSDSISSFSSDDDEEQNKPPRYNGRHLDSNLSGQFPKGRSESVSSASNTNNNSNITPRLGSFSASANLGLPVPQDSSLPTPYLSPASLMS